MQVPTLTNQVRLQAAPNVQQSPLRSTALEDLGQGVANAGAVIEHVQKQEQVKADRTQLMESSRQLDTASNDLHAQAQSRQGKDAIGITPQVMTDFDKQAGEIAGSLRKSDRLQQAYREQVNNRRDQLQRQVETHEGQQRQKYEDKAREDFKDQAHINAVTNYKDPQAINQSLAEMRSAINQTPGMDDAQRATEYGVRSSGIHADIVRRYLGNDDIKGADTYYKSVAGQVNGDKASLIENWITDAKRIAENRARALADHRDAIADRALNEIDRQISSGVPATPEMWSGWESKVRGTPAAGEFKDRLQAERDVQEKLRAPIDEQIRFVQQAQQKLDTQGGTLREAANMQRMATAVKQNVQTLQTDPLLFQSNRTGLQVQPLDFGSIGQEGSGFAAQVADRAATLQSMQKTYGAQVPQKLLLPQEVAQLSSALNGASSEQAASMFGQLRNAIGDDKLYAATIQQVAPDNPVKALAGLLAARDRTQTLTTHWFKPNDTIDSQKVASTILAGQDIISPPKGEKSADGKPKLALLLPPEADKGLQSQFASAVGTAFADRPDALQTAYQSVKAYYVGKAAANGKIATDHTDVDPHIVKEAVQSILGNVVDVNGHGEVLAPWGMKSSDFTDAAQAAFEKQTQDVTWPGGAPLPFHVLGLKAKGADSYYVTAGRSFLQDKQGQPVVLSLGAPAEERSSHPVGMKVKGNLDPYARKPLKNADGTTSTTSSISIGTDDGEVLIPTVVDGKRLSNADAVAHYRKTGEHFGIFDTPENADDYSVKLHNDQARHMGLTP